MSNWKVNINVDANELIRQAFRMMTLPLNKCEQDKDDDGGRFVSYTDALKCYSCYFHPVKRHSAKAQSVKRNGEVIREQRSIGEAGEWGCGECLRGFGVCRTLHNVL